MKINDLQNKIIFILAMIFFYLPVFFVILGSFNASNTVTIWQGFSTKWYLEILSNGIAIKSLFTSIEIAFFSAILATTVGTIIGAALTRKKQKNIYEKTSSAAIYIPLILPDVIIGFSILMLFIFFQIERSLITVIIAHTIYSSCFVVLIVQARLGTKEEKLENAAIDLGCSPMRAFIEVTLPNILQSIIAGFLISLSLSFDDLIVASFTSGSGIITLPMYIYSRLNTGINPQINVISTIIILVIFIFLIFWHLFEKQNQEEEVKNN